MKVINVFKPKNWSLALLAAITIMFLGNAAQVFAHGGEDHGEEKPKVATTEKGTVTRTMRLGDFEITFKHSVLEPDAATDGRLFITKYETNEAVNEAAPTMEIESANGSVTQVAVEKGTNAGSYNLKIPALPEGNYSVRANLKSGGETDTAVFSGVEVAHPAAETAAGGASWFGSALFYLVSAAVLGLFGVLFYFVWRMAGDKQVGEETVSA
ncbi:MAG TPA: hypothetical protein VNI84_13180 [Pyrinomonadaceae bacterium]|nr:hypothetical protein [Pyrinomonadaceae bacterium]